MAANSHTSPASSLPIEGETSSADELRLLAAIAQGDRDAFATIYDSYAPRVYGMARRVLRRESDAEAVVSDVFLSLWESPNRFDASRGPFRTYLLMLARSRSIDRLRANAKRTDRTAAAAASATPALVQREQSRRPDAQIADKEDRALLRAAVVRLDAKQRKPLEMAYFEGLTHVEIAERLGEPLGTIKTRIRTALSTLRSTLRSVGRPSDGL